jgi:Tol biopolymer transport system component
MRLESTLRSFSERVFTSRAPPVSIAALIMIAPGCGTTDSTTAPLVDTRIIAFSSDSGLSGRSGIFLMHADGSNKILLTSAGNYNNSPAWARDGHAILFDSDRQSSPAKVWVINADGSNPHLLANGTTARWSPDGSKIIYTGLTSQGVYVVYVANADGSGAQRLTANPAGEVRPAWSPDGAKIVFSAYPVQNMNLYVVNANGTGQVQITASPGFDEDADWSPDGAHIAFTRGTDGGLGAVHIIAPDGSDDRTLTAVGCSQPSRSPDSRQLTETCIRNSRPQIFRMNADGSDFRPITTAGYGSSSPAWSPR